MDASAPRKEHAKWRDLGARTLSAAVLIPAVLLDVWLGDIWFNLLVAILAVMMAHEWANIVHGRNSIQFALHAASALFGAFLPQPIGWPVTFVVIALLTLASVMLLWAQKRSLSLWAVCGVPYVGLPAMAFIVLRHEPQSGMFAILWLLCVVWAADICAYFAGRIIGGPRLAPVISPNKTWAGLAGAIAGGTASGVVLGLVAGVDGVAYLAGLGAVLAIVEQLGDLFESALKRHYGVKDSGNLIPGHGGLLDRMDGLVAASLVLAIVGIVAAALGSNGLFVR